MTFSLQIFKPFNTVLRNRMLFKPLSYYVIYGYFQTYGREFPTHKIVIEFKSVLCTKIKYGFIFLFFKHTEL